MASESIASMSSLVSTTSSGSSEISITRIRDVDTAATERQVIAAESLAKTKAAIAEQAQVSREAFEKVVSELEAYVQSTQRNLDFHVDDNSGRVIVKVIDASSDEVIRQIPSEEMLAISRKLQEFLDEHNPRNKGVLVELKA
jgi:flagellar protein FlaG